MRRASIRVALVLSRHRFCLTDARGPIDSAIGATGAACTGGNPVEWYVSQLPKKITDRTINYIGPHFEVSTTAAGVARYRLLVFAGERAVYSRIETVTGTAVAAPEAYYLHRDHQGSVVKLTPALAEHTPGLYKTAFSFDALGQRRQVNGLAGGTTIYGENQWTDRGYTGHEHLDDVELIHMNGRVQHPGLGRFLSPYSYVANKPLVFTDPSGFEIFEPFQRGWSDSRQDIDERTSSGRCGGCTYVTPSAASDYTNRLFTSPGGGSQNLPAAREPVAEQQRESQRRQNNRMESRGARDRGRAARPDGTKNPTKHVKPHPTRPGWVRDTSNPNKQKVDRPARPGEPGYKDKTIDVPVIGSEEYSGPSPEEVAVVVVIGLGLMLAPQVTIPILSIGLATQ
jgi:hypothetical protein